jgi:hypothetical protein
LQPKDLCSRYVLVYSYGYEMYRKVKVRRQQQLRGPFTTSRQRDAVKLSAMCQDMVEKVKIIKTAVAFARTRPWELMSLGMPRRVLKALARSPRPKTDATSNRQPIPRRTCWTHWRTLTFW